MSPTPEQRAAARLVAELNARSTRTVEAIANVLVAVVVGILLAAALLHFLTPCDAATLCGAVVTPTRLSPWARLRVEAEHALLRLRLAVRAWHLRHKLAAAEFDLQYLPDDIQAAQEQLEYTRLHAETLRLQLEDCRLAARRH